MNVVRINEFRAKEGKAEALRSSLTPFIPMIALAAGCLSCQLLQSNEKPTRFVILEVWDSIESHQAAMKTIPAKAIAEVMELMDGAPVGEYYHE